MDLAANIDHMVEPVSRAALHQTSNTTIASNIKGSIYHKIMINFKPCQLILSFLLTDMQDSGEMMNSQKRATDTSIMSNTLDGQGINVDLRAFPP